MLPVNESAPVTLAVIDELEEYCRVNMMKHPTAYYALFHVFANISEEFGDQAVTTERYREITELFPLLARWRDNPEDFALLDEVIRRVAGQPSNA